MRNQEYMSVSAFPLFDIELTDKFLCSKPNKLNLKAEHSGSFLCLKPNMPTISHI